MKSISSKSGIKALIILFVLVIISSHSFSQITIVPEDFPQVGMLVVKDVDSTTVINPGSAGLNQTWDFSNLVPSYTDSTLYMMPDGLPGSQNFPASNIVLKDARASANYDGSYNYMYYKSSPTGWQVVGQELKISFWGISFFWHFSYDPDPVVLPLPCQYNTSSSQEVSWNSYSASWYNGTQADTSHVVTHMSIDMLADASGTIITPTGSFDALRVHEHIVNVDTVFNYTPGSGWSFEETSTVEWDTYRWYANGIGEVGSIRIDNKKGSNGFSFYKSQALVGQQELKKDFDVCVYPNPATEGVSIESKQPVDRIEIISENGRILTITDNCSYISLKGMSSGYYFLKIFSGDSMSVKKIIKK